MTQEEKELWLKDLCARVPYHPKGRVVNNINGAECEEYLTCATFSMFTIVHNNSRLYLRPMSSMTEEERATVEQIAKDNRLSPYGKINNKGCDNLILAIAHQGVPVIQYLYSRHFDLVGLIEKGLALEAPEGMYKVNDKEV